MRIQWIGFLPAIIIFILAHIGAYYELKYFDESYITILCILTWILIALEGILWGLS